jgi:hypothetical protein
MKRVVYRVAMVMVTTMIPILESVFAMRGTRTLELRTCFDAFHPYTTRINTNTKNIVPAKHCANVDSHDGRSSGANCAYSDDVVITAERGVESVREEEEEEEEEEKVTNHPPMFTARKAKLRVMYKILKVLLQRSHLALWTT